MMHALGGPNGPMPGELEETLCASCIFGTVVVLRVRPDDEGDAPRQVWHTRSFCRNLSIAGSGTHEFEDPVFACDKFHADPSQEAPAPGEPPVPRVD